MITCSVTVITGDGVHGYPSSAPYDRIVATAAVLAGALPYEWVRQTVPGGMILTPWGTSFRNGELVSLIVQPDATAVGSIVDAVAFMRLRSQRTPLGAAQLGELVEHSTSAIESVTSLCPEEIISHEDSEFAIGVFLADVQYSIAPTSGGLNTAARPDPLRTHHHSAHPNRVARPA